MKQMKMFGLGQVCLLALHLSAASAHPSLLSMGFRQPADEDPSAEADRIANEVTLDAENAHQAADVAKQAAVVANNVAEHSMKITHHAKTALKHALGALHEARVSAEGMDESQKESLKKAEAKLKEATKTADYGKLKKVQDAHDLKMEKMQAELDRKKKTTELEQMKTEVRELRERLDKSGGDSEGDKELKELEWELDRLEKVEASRKAGDKADDKADAATNDEMKAEIERLRVQVDKLEEQQGSVQVGVPEAKSETVHHNLPHKEQKEEEEEGGTLMRDVQMKPLDKGDRAPDVTRRVMDIRDAPTPVEEKGIDIDTAMPYGDLEPFGREDTAQELTESSVRESDGMVDQLERAEVAEEKRSVFRALTRLRGAAITSFDGVARSQTGNIDEYNKIHKWRKTHPLHHLADEESDVTKWAFPDNADFVQMKDKASLKGKHWMMVQERIK